MDKTDVPEELVRAATKARWAAVGHVEFADEVRLMLAAVLPLVEKQVGAQVRAELEAEVKRLRLQNDELSTENHEMQYGPTVSDEEL